MRQKLQAYFFLTRTHWFYVRRQHGDRRCLHEDGWGVLHVGHHHGQVETENVARVLDGVGERILRRTPRLQQLDHIKGRETSHFCMHIYFQIASSPQLVVGII
jgi:hypothetical protein